MRRGREIIGLPVIDRSKREAKGTEPLEAKGTEPFASCFTVDTKAPAYYTENSKGVDGTSHP